MFLQTKLPEYMIPTGFVELESLPLTANGKVDRKALVTLEPTGPTPRADTQTTPASELESTMAAIAGEVIGVSELRVDQNFFDAGARSARTT